MAATDTAPYRRLAGEVVLDAVTSIKNNRPPKRMKGEDLKDYLRRFRARVQQRRNDIAWFRDRGRSGMWIEAAGLEWDSVVSRLSMFFALPEPNERDITKRVLRATTRENESDKRPMSRAAS